MDSDHTAYSEIKIGSTRSFGLVFAIVFALIGTYPLLTGASPHLWALATSALFLAFSFVFTWVLEPLNRLWFRFGMMLGRIVNPIVMLIIYGLTILPFGVAIRALRKDLLRLRLDRETHSYWIDRRPPGPEPESLKDQF
jgi:hypothetical protein